MKAYISAKYMQYMRNRPFNIFFQRAETKTKTVAWINAINLHLGNDKYIILQFLSFGPSFSFVYPFAFVLALHEEYLVQLCFNTFLKKKKTKKIGLSHHNLFSELQNFGNNMHLFDEYRHKHREEKKKIDENHHWKFSFLFSKEKKLPKLYDRHTCNHFDSIRFGLLCFALLFTYKTKLLFCFKSKRKSCLLNYSQNDLIQICWFSYCAIEQVNSNIHNPEENSLNNNALFEMHFSFRFNYQNYHFHLKGISSI